jgi:hypothetical protein
VLVATAPCVKVVVDYGTFAHAPPGPNTHCTAVASGATAAEALDKRWRDLHTTPPRYQGNFLCALDGYPESGCGIQSGPYWSFWYWANGRWTYSQFGVDSYSIGDSDRDGHPDPIGFRYQPESAPEHPRADPSYPSPTPAPTTPAPVRTTTHAAPAPTSARPSPRASTTTAPTTASAAVTTTPPATTAVAAPEPTAPPGIAPSRAAHRFPVATLLVAAVALLLLGGTAWRFRRTS